LKAELLLLDLLTSNRPGIRKGIERDCRELRKSDEFYTGIRKGIERFVVGPRLDFCWWDLESGKELKVSDSGDKIVSQQLLLESGKELKASSPSQGRT